MTITRSIRALACAGVAAAALVAGPAEPASACGFDELCNPSIPPLPDIDGASSGSGGSVNGTCAAIVGVAADLRSTTFTFQANATATTTNSKAVPAGVGVVCKLIDAGNGFVYGTARGGVPGPTAVAVGAATVPNGRPLRVCVDSNAVFSDGSTARDANC